MRHTNFQDKLSSFSIVSDSDQLPKRIYTFDLTNGVQEIAFPTVIQIGDYYKITLTTEDRDYFIFIEWGLIREIVRVGDPDVLVIGRAGDTGLQIYYKHINATDGSVIDEGYFTEKIFQAFEGGTIPLYWSIGFPEPDIINKNKYCFCDVKNKEELE